jgi:hypothetical protein
MLLVFDPVISLLGSYTGQTTKNIFKNLDVQNIYCRLLNNNGEKLKKTLNIPKLKTNQLYYGISDLN